MATMLAKMVKCQEFADAGGQRALEAPIPDLASTMRCWAVLAHGGRPPVLRGALRVPAAER
jgi:hypothetical protein